MYLNERMHGNAAIYIQLSARSDKKGGEFIAWGPMTNNDFEGARDSTEWRHKPDIAHSAGLDLETARIFALGACKHTFVNCATIDFFISKHS